MAKRARNKILERAAAPVELPALDLTEAELADAQWCVVSADPAKPLTEEQARQVSPL